MSKDTFTLLALCVFFISVFIYIMWLREPYMILPSLLMLPVRWILFDRKNY